ncbi:MAG: hypothetical protein KBF88_10900, partial [Polyangiaceae bacterium]|nr:hypothetical protein [Polyangiaceae bacterium]
MRTIGWLIACGIALMGSGAVLGCSSEAIETGESEDELAVTKDARWIYDGPLPALQNPRITVSMVGHTARLSGYLPPGVSIPELPHARQTAEGGRTRIDLVYP